MYGYKDQAKAMSPMMMTMADQRKSQYPGYHMSQPHQDTGSRGHVISGTPTKMMPLPMTYPSGQGPNVQPMSSQSNAAAAYYYANSVQPETSARYPSDPGSRYPRSHHGCTGSTVAKSIATGTTSAGEVHKRGYVYGSGSIQNGMPVVSPSMSDRISYGSAIPESPLSPLRIQTTPVGTVNAGMLASPHSGQGAMSEVAAQNSSGYTGVFKLPNQQSEYRQRSGHESKSVPMEKQSPVTSPRSSVYSTGYQHASKHPAYLHPPSSQAVKVGVHGQPSAAQTAMQGVSRHTSMRQGYQGQTHQYSPLHSPTGPQHRQVEAMYSTQRSPAPSVNQISPVASEAMRRSGQVSSAVPSSQRPYSQSVQRAVLPSGIGMSAVEKHHSGYSVPHSQSSRSPVSHNISAGASVQGYPQRKVDIKPQPQLMPVNKQAILQSSMPLDLTSADMSSSSSASETPLDLSVKTRKRCADTTISTGLLEQDSRGIHLMKKPKQEIGVDLRSKEYASKNMITAPQPQKMTYDTVDIKLQQNTNSYTYSDYLKINKCEPQRVGVTKSETPLPKSEPLHSNMYGCQDNRYMSYQSASTVKSPIMIQSKYDEQKVCYPSPPEVDAYPLVVSQKPSAPPQLHVSSQSAVYPKTSVPYSDSMNFNRGSSYGHSISPSYRVQSEHMQTTNSYQKPVSSNVTAQTPQQCLGDSPSSINSSSSNNTYRPHIYQSVQQHPHVQQQLQQRQLSTQQQEHQQQQQQQQQRQQQQHQQKQQQHQRISPQNQQQRHQIQYSHYAGKALPTTPSVSPGCYSQGVPANRNMYQSSKKEEAHHVSGRYLEQPRSQTVAHVANVPQQKPLYAMTLPRSSGYMVTTEEKRDVQKKQVVTTTLYKPPISDEQTVQTDQGSSSAQSTPDIQITGVTAPPVKKQEPESHADKPKDQVNIMKYAEPLSITIPTSTGNSEQKPPVVKSVPHKNLSKKHRILNALSQEEDQKRVSANVATLHHIHRTVDGVFKLPTVSPASPASPKMPILSPHDKLPPPEDASVHNEPPQLDPPATPVKNRLIPGAASARGDSAQRAQQAYKLGKDKDVSAKGIASKPIVEQQPSNAIQTRPSDKYPRPEVIRRNSLPERPSVYQKNIPVANVAPFVHSNKDQSESHSEDSLLAEVYLTAESAPSQGDGESKDSQNVETKQKHTKPTSGKKQKPECPKGSQKNTSQYIRKIAKLSRTNPRKKELKFLAAPLKYNLMKATREMQQMEQADLSRIFKTQVLRPRQKPPAVKQSQKAKRKPVRITKKQKRKVTPDTVPVEEEKQDSQADEEPGEKAVSNPPHAARQDRALRRAVIKIDRIETKVDVPVKSEQHSSSTHKGVSNLSRRAQELKRKAIDGPRRRGRRRLTQYNRNAAYEKELRKDESRRALNRAKRRARLRRGSRPDSDYPEEEEYGDDEDDDADGCWEISKTSSAQRPTATNGRDNGGLMMKLYYRSGQDPVPTRGRRGRQARDPEMDGNILTPVKQLRGKGRLRGRMKAKGKFQSQFEQFLKQDMTTDSDAYNEAFHVGYDEDATTYQCSDASGVMTSYPIPPEMKKLAINKNSGETMLHRAARLGYEDVALYCIRVNMVKVNARDNAGYTALHECCVKGNLNVARCLIEHGANPNCCSQDGIRPIHDAVENDHVEIVRLLLSYGADPSIATYGGKTPITISHSAAMTTLLKGYFNDLNGCEEDIEEAPWEFNGSSLCNDAPEVKGFDLFADLPSDPEDETDGLFDVEMVSAIRTYDLHLESSDRLDRYVYVRDVMADFHLSREDLKKMCGNKIQLHKISAKELCKSTEKNVLTFCQQTTTPVELINFENYKKLEPKMVEHLRKDREQEKNEKHENKEIYRNRPSTPSKKSKKQQKLGVEFSDNESDATIELGSLYNSDEDSIDFTDNVYLFTESDQTTSKRPEKRKSKFKSKHELAVHLKKDMFGPKSRKTLTDNNRNDSTNTTKAEGHHAYYSNTSQTPKSESNLLFKNKQSSISKSKRDPSPVSNKSINPSKSRIRDASFDSSKASMKAQSEHVYSFDDQDSVGSADDDPEVTFPRIDRLYPERTEKPNLRKERTVDCKKGLEKSFRTIMGNSKEDHIRFKIGTVSQESLETPGASQSGSDVPETSSTSHSHIKS